MHISRTDSSSEFRMESKGEKSDETVTLILKEQRFEVEKQKLIHKSQYFAALLSVNYQEYNQTEHVIHYDVSSVLLQDFINWIHCDKIALAFTNNDSGDLNHLLTLLELSVLFATNKLVEDITYKLEENFMSPSYAIDIWLLSLELCTNVLRDVSFAICLDRFDELPLDSIYKLSKENFLKLIGNINVRSTKSRLIDIAHKWMNHNHDFTIPTDNLKKEKEKILHGIFSFEHSIREKYIHCWDGNDFFELTSFEYPSDIENCCSTNKSLDGMQIIARRYNLYLCGGEYGYSGKYNNNIWRYSLISKKWFLETTIPVERRNMITVFIKNKLLVVGGIGSSGDVLYTVNIYDIYTGTWTLGANINYENAIPLYDEYVVFGNNLIIFNLFCFGSIHVYFSDPDVWVWIKIDSLFSYILLTFETRPCYIDIVDRDNIFLRIITETCDVENCNNVLRAIPISIANTNNVPITEGIRLFRVPTLSLISSTRKNILLCTDIDLKTLHIHTIRIQNTKKFHSLIPRFSLMANPCKMFFNLLHPAYLHKTINFDHI